jgi:hypothetical protein
MNASLRIVLAEDHATVREGLRLLIDHQPDMTVVADASDGDDGAVGLVARDDIDLVFMDSSMSGTSWAFRRTCLARTPARCQDRHLHWACRSDLSAGAPPCWSARLRAQTKFTERLLHAIRAAAAGGHHIDPR